MKPEKTPTASQLGTAPRRLRMAGRGAADTAEYSGEPALTRVRESVRARMPTPEEQHELGLNAGVPVLVLSSTPEDQLGLRVLKAGAAGYLNKQTALEELVQAVRKVLAGGKYVSTKLADKLVVEVGRSEKVPHEQLSDREFQVMQMIAAGQSLKEIAAKLSLSAKTISTFRGRVIEKLNVQNNVELAHYARTYGLIPERGP